MIKEIEFCDWCKKRKPVVIVIAGDEQGMKLCSKCQIEFIDGLKDIYFDDLIPTYFEKQEEDERRLANGEN